MPYLSPFGLRYRLEALLLQHGSAVINTQWLHQHEPSVLWGVLWYSARLKLPSGFMHANPCPSANLSTAARVALSHHQCPIVVGWRACTVEGYAARLLSGRVLDTLSPSELFPGCSLEDAGIIERVVIPALDGSPASMRVAMVHLSECTSVMAYGASLNMTRARFLNLSLLMLAYLYNKTNLVVPREFTKIGHLNKVRYFCICAMNWIQQLRVQNLRPSVRVFLCSFLILLIDLNDYCRRCCSRRSLWTPSSVSLAAWISK